MLVIAVELRTFGRRKYVRLYHKLVQKPIYLVNAEFGTVDTSESLDNTQSPHSTENELSIDMLFAG